MARPLPTGVQHFRNIRERGHLYVDKTDMISQILIQQAEVYLYAIHTMIGR